LPHIGVLNYSGDAPKMALAQLLETLENPKP
jgi:hypothetical protein